MGKFQTTAGKPLWEDTSGRGIVWLHMSGSKLTLKFAEGRGTGPTDGRKIVPDDPTKMTVADVVKGPSAMSCSLKASGPGLFVVSGFNAAGTVAHSLLVVAGSFNNHSGMDTDLLAGICQSGDADRIFEVQRVLYNDRENLFDQHNAKNVKENDGACGKVCNASGQKVFSKINPISYENPYHEKLKAAVAKRDDVKYRSTTIGTVRTVIKDWLNKGVPVRVGTLHGPIGMFLTNGKLYAYYLGGHTVLIVGCNSAADKFLYIDPWAGGSKLKYDGAPAAAGLGVCNYLGMFEAIYDSARAVELPMMSPNLIRQTTASEGSFNTPGGNFQEVVSGPFVPQKP